MNKFWTLLFVGACGSAFAAAPTDYYNKCENKGGAALLSALCATVGEHISVGYNDLWDVYTTTDVKSNGKIWDMYSTKEWTPRADQCGNYSNVGDCYNREHSMPKSWFNDAVPMYTDAFHIYPTDGKVNGQRANFPYGECSKGTTLASHGGIEALGKLGTSTFPGYTGTVFEPVDEYKGDFARSYFYMAAAYNDRISTWNSEMLGGTSYPAFTDWAVELLLKWHRQDPVSDKELLRNEAVYAWQENRNPFIDNPEMVEYIWGDKKTEKWTSSAGAQPAIITPVNNSVIDLGTVAVGVARSLKINVRGTALRSDVTVNLEDATGTMTFNPSILKAAQLNLSTGEDVTITIAAKTAGNYSGVMSLTSVDGIATKVTLMAKAVEGLPATEPTNITDESFVAHWTYIGDADKNGCYTLHVLDAKGNDIDTYPRSVVAKDEYYLVDELEPSTDYIFFISNNSLTSNRMNVRTAAPIPNIQIMYDGELLLVAEPGIPSEAAELFLDIENIFEDITFSVAAPFELSSDKGNWSTSVSVDPREDRIYIRIYGNEDGSYTTSIRATAGSYINDDAVVTGQIYEMTSFLEDFEADITGNYTTTSYSGSACEWNLNNAGVYREKADAYEGTNYLRFGNNNNSYAEMADDRTSGIGTVTLYAAGWSASDGASSFSLQYSTDQGKTWENAGDVSIAAPTSNTKTYAQYTFAVNQSGNVRLRIQQKSGKRMCIDNISLTNYFNAADDIVFGDEKGSGWDAYCADGALTISLSENAKVAVYGVDGNTYVSAALSEGNHMFSLPKGLYIVVVGNSTRRVLIK